MNEHHIDENIPREYLTKQENIKLEEMENSRRKRMCTPTSTLKDYYTFLTSGSPIQEEPRNFKKAKASSDSTLV